MENTPADMAKYIHWGATTQDIMDDASIIQIRSGLRIVKRELSGLVDVLKKLAEKYRDTYVMSCDCLPLPLGGFC